MRNLQKNLNVIWQPPPPTTILPNPHFSSKNFQTPPISINFEKVEPTLYEGRVRTTKCQFCNFHAVFGNFTQIVPPPVDPIWETLLSPQQYYNAANTTGPK